MLKARQKLGKYRIVRRLSNGHIAAVYEARDTIQGQAVALKIPHKSAMDDFFLADFMREARLAERLQHPNILSIRDASYIDDRFVIAMPLGRETLTERMSRRISTTTALQLIEQMLGAVAHAHRVKVIHCDIKPDNFILFGDNQVRLTDFGFSKVAERLGIPQSRARALLDHKQPGIEAHYLHSNALREELLADQERMTACNLKTVGKV